MNRHDARRTATADGKAPSSITLPAAVWRHYLGGSVQESGLLSTDLDGDGRDELVLIAGGKIVTKHADDSVLWETEPLDLARLGGVVDLDGDGKLEVVAYGAQTYVFAGASGAVLWQEPDNEIGHVDSVRAGDLDGDGKAELVIDECTCCDDAMGAPGWVWSFAGGYPKAQRLYGLPKNPHCFAGSNTLGDFDGDGLWDVGKVSDTATVLSRGRDGMLLGVSSAVSTGRGDTAECEAANIDGRAGDELVCVLSDYWSNSNMGGYRAWAVTYDPGPMPSARLLWLVDFASMGGSMVRPLPGGLADLDADGQLELVLVTDGMDGPIIRVLDAKTGTELGRVPGRSGAVFDLDGDGKPELIAYLRPTSHAYTFRRAGVPALTERWAYTGRFGVANAPDWQRALRTANASRVIAIDLDGDGHPDPLFSRQPDDMTPGELRVLKADGAATPTELATLTLPDGVVDLGNLLAHGLTRPGSQIVYARNDGFLVVLDENFRPTNEEAGEFPLPGARIGGYYSGLYGYAETPIAPALGDSVDGNRVDSVITPDSRGALLRLDPKSASLITPPSVRWALPRSHSPVLLPAAGAGQRGIGCYFLPTPQSVRWNVEALDVDGQVRWQSELADTPNEDLVPGDADGDGLTDLFTATKDGSQWATFQVWSGKDGAPLWATPYALSIRSWLRGFSVADWDGDGKDDLVGEANRALALRGLDGKPIALGAPGDAHLSTLFDVDGDNALELVVHSGFRAATAYGHDLVSVAWSGTDDKNEPDGAPVVCPRGPAWVDAQFVHRGALHSATMSGPGKGEERVVYLAGGGLYASAAAAMAAGHRLGVLGNVSIKIDLAGPGTHPSVVVGSSDGWLYAVDACAGTLDWSYAFGAPVGEPIFADTNGDGHDEVLVTVADGYLYALAQQVLAAPQHVIDLDPEDGQGTLDGTADVDAITTRSNTLGARWDAVTDAESYEVAVITPGGSYVTQPDWQNVGNVTAVARGSLPLVDGRRYRFAVRAVSKKGSSNEATSNGVVVHIAPPPPDMATPPPPPPTTPPPRTVAASCACDLRQGRSSPSGPTRPMAAALLLGGVAWLARRRSNPTARRRGLPEARRR